MEALLYLLHPLPVRVKQEGMTEGNGQAQVKRTCSRSLLFWFFCFRPLQPLDLSQFLFLWKRPKSVFYPHMWIFTLPINISCTEFRHSIASQLFIVPIGGQSNSAVFTSWQHQKSICDQLPLPPPPNISHHLLLKKWLTYFFSFISL